jgi:putative ABC transport system ATP-binding protein
VLYGHPVVAPVARAQPRTTLVVARDLEKVFARGSQRLQILQGLHLEVGRGSFEALMGPSGSGKSTLLNILAGLDRPTSGTLMIDGVNITELSDAALSRWRANTLGFVFQSYNLIPVMTAIENVMLPLRLTKAPRREWVTRAKTALRVVQLEDRINHYPSQLSGGQEQRVSIARAIVNDPSLIIADEPTGDLDRKAADDILTVFEKLSSELGKTIIMVTHDPDAAARAHTVHRLNKGTLAG